MYIVVLYIVWNYNWWYSSTLCSLITEHCPATGYKLKAASACGFISTFCITIPLCTAFRSPVQSTDSLGRIQRVLQTALVEDRGSYRQTALVEYRGSYRQPWLATSLSSWQPWLPRVGQSDSIIKNQRTEQTALIADRGPYRQPW